MKMKNETEWAIRNLELAGWLKKDGPYDGMIGEAVIKLLKEHQKEGHSGMSHSITVSLFKSVAFGEALTMEFWQEKFDAYNEWAKTEGQKKWTESNFEEIVMKKPKHLISPGID
jgi:hypothetical protein